MPCPLYSQILILFGGINENNMLKATLSTLLLLTIAASIFAGEAPAATQKAFIAKFPKAEKIKWEKESTNNYEASFTLGNVAMSANFDADGNWIETETSIAVKELPQGVSNYVAKIYPKAKITEAAKIERPATDVFIYEAQITENGKKTDLILTEDGKLTK